MCFLSVVRGSILRRVLHRPDGHSVIPGVVVHVRVRRVEVQVVSIRGIIERSGPVVAVRAKILKRSTIVVACGWQRCLRRIETLWYDVSVAA